MSRLPQSYLKPNPFTTYRDPHTGRWVVIQENVTYLAQASVKRRDQRQVGQAQARTATAPLLYGANCQLD